MVKKELYCDICKCKIEGEYDLDNKGLLLLNGKPYDLCRSCKIEIKEFLQKLEQEKLSDLPF